MADLDIRIKADFLTHHKLDDLRERIGPKAPEHLIALWIYAARNRTKGVLYEMTQKKIAQAARYFGDPQVFIAALVDSGWLDLSPEKLYELHDWEQHQPHVWRTEERSQWGKEMAAKKYGTDATRIPTANDTHTAPHAPTPTPIPDPIPSPVPIPKIKSDRVQELVDLYHEILPELPTVQKLDKSQPRYKAALARLKEFPWLGEEESEGGVGWWWGLFNRIHYCPHLMGKNDRGWTATFEWIMNPTNLQKIIEGNYDDRSNKAAKPDYGQPGEVRR